MQSHTGLCCFAEACLQLCYCFVWCNLHAHATGADSALWHISSAAQLCSLRTVLSCICLTILLPYHNLFHKANSSLVCRSARLRYLPDHACPCLWLPVLLCILKSCKLDCTWLCSGLGEIGVEQPHPRFLKGSKEHNFVRVAAGASHSLALTSSGQVWSFGQGSFGTLGTHLYPPHLQTSPPHHPPLH